MIAVGGEYGTLSEIALALKMGKPVVGLKTWVIRPPGAVGAGIIHCDTAAAAVEAAWQGANAANPSHIT